MAFTEFYIQTTGSNTNAGSTNTDAATASATNGNWDSTTGIYIAPSGTPFSATQVGDWASIYIDGASVAVFIAQVTAVTSSTQITVSLTVKFGTAPTTSGTTRSCKIGGAHASWLGINTAMSSGTTPVALRINIKAGTYSYTSYTTLGVAGTTTLPIWIRGYKTTPGDLDTRPTSNRVDGTDIPLMSYTSNNRFQATASAYNIMSNIAFTAAISISDVTVNFSGIAVRCRFYQTTASASSGALNAGNGRFINCLVQATTTSNAIVSNMGSSTFDNCVFIGGVNTCNSFNIGSPSTTIINSVFRGYTGNALAPSTNHTLRVENCTFRGGTNGIYFAATPAAHSVISNNMFHSCSVAGINNASGTNTGNVLRWGNAFYNCGSQGNGFGDSPAFDSISESSDPLTSSTNMTLVSGALSKGACGGLFEGESYSSYLDAGAVQRQESGGGSTQSAYGFIF